MQFFSPATSSFVLHLPIFLIFKDKLHTMLRCELLANTSLGMTLLLQIPILSLGILVDSAAEMGKNDPFLWLTNIKVPKNTVSHWFFNKLSVMWHNTGPSLEFGVFFCLNNL